MNFIRNVACVVQCVGHVFKILKFCVNYQSTLVSRETFTYKACHVSVCIERLLPIRHVMCQSV